MSRSLPAVTACAIGALCTVLFLPATAKGVAPLYCNLDDPRLDPQSTVPYANNIGDPSHILWDDVPVEVGTIVGASADVTRLTFEIRRAANAPAVVIDLYWAPMVADLGPNRGGSNPAVSPFDGGDEDPGTPNFIQQVSLDANGPTLTRTTITIGDAANTLFNTGPLNKSYSPTIGFFMIGMKMSTAGQENGWTLAEHPLNLDLVWEDYNNAALSTIDEFTYDVDSLGNPIRGIHMVCIEGVVVPEPATMSLLVLGSAGLLLTRRRHA